MVREPSPVMFDHLYSLSDRGEYDELIRHIREHDDEEVRYGAAGVLSESVDGFEAEMTPATRKALVQAVLNDPSDAVRANVVRTLLHIDESMVDNIITRLEATPEATPTETPYPLILTKWHGTRWAELRFLAVAGFGSVATESAVEKLRTTIVEESDLRVVRRAIEEGGRVGDETFVDPITEYLRVDDTKLYQSANPAQIKRTKQTAAKALVEIGTDAAYEALVTATRGTDEELSASAVGELGAFGTEETVELIVDELDSDDSEAVRREAAEGLITNFMAADFEDGDAVRRRALERISETVEADVSGEFAAIVEESPRKSEQRNAAWLLGQLDSDDEETIEGLIEALDDEDGYLRIIAAAGLANLDRSELTTRLDAFLDSVDEDSEAHALATEVKASLQDGREEVT